MTRAVKKLQKFFYHKFCHLQVFGKVFAGWSTGWQLLGQALPLILSTLE